MKILSLNIVNNFESYLILILSFFLSLSHRELNSTGNLGIGHTRYSTSGGIDLQLAQPFVVHTSYGTLSVAHNGELVNSKKLRKKVLESGEYTTSLAGRIVPFNTKNLLIGEALLVRLMLVGLCSVTFSRIEGSPC